MRDAQYVAPAAHTSHKETTCPSYMVRKSYLALSAGLILAIAACDRSTGLSTSISQAAANTLAADMDAVSSLAPTDIGFGPLAIRVPGSVSTASITVDPGPVNVTRTRSS